jgi:hypothetical protein
MSPIDFRPDHLYTHYGITREAPGQIVPTLIRQER